MKSTTYEKKDSAGTKMVDIDFENPTLRSIAQAFDARKKALKYKTHSYFVRRQIESGPSKILDEVLLIEMSVVDSTGNIPRLRVKIWPDRWVSGVSYLRGNSSEKWTSNFDGRMSSNMTPKKFQKHIENFIDNISIGMHRSPSDASAYWYSNLIHGPIGLVQDNLWRQVK
jgi:hypothetical protein